MLLLNNFPLSVKTTVTYLKTSYITIKLHISLMVCCSFCNLKTSYVTIKPRDEMLYMLEKTFKNIICYY